MSQGQFEKVYVSYNWATEEKQPVVDNLQAWCKAEEVAFQVVTEKDELKYKAFIDKFMQTIAENWCVIAVISEKYMRSLYCMTELLKTYKAGDFDKRLLPIKIEDYWPSGDEQVKLIDHWEKEVEKVKGKETEEAKGVREISENLETLLDALRINGKPHSTEDNAVFNKIAEIIHLYQEQEIQRSKQLKKLATHKRKAEASIKEQIKHLPFVKEFEDVEHFCQKMKTSEAISKLYSQAITYEDKHKYNSSSQLDIHFMWKRVNEIMGWRVTLAVEEKTIGSLPVILKHKDMLYYEIPVSGEIATEIFAALRHGNRAQFKADPDKPRTTTGGCNLSSHIPANGWGKEDPMLEVYKAVWRHIFNESKDSFSAYEIDELNEELRFKLENDGKTIYFSVDKNEEDHPLLNSKIYTELLSKDKLSNLIVVIKDTDSNTELFDDKETRLQSPIRSFVIKTYELEANPKKEPVASGNP